MSPMRKKASHVMRMNQWRCYYSCHVFVTNECSKHTNVDHACCSYFVMMIKICDEFICINSKTTLSVGKKLLQGQLIMDAYFENHSSTTDKSVFYFFQRKIRFKLIKPFRWTFFSPIIFVVVSGGWIHAKWDITVSTKSTEKWSIHKGTSKSINNENKIIRVDKYK